MAGASNYYDSELLAYQTAVNPDYNKAELRELETMVLNVGLQNQDFLMNTPNLNKVKESVNRPVYGYVKQRKPSTNGTAMTAFNTGIGGTSAQQVLTWIAFTEEFYFNETTGYDNVFDKASLFQNEIQQAQRNLRERLRVWLTQQLYAGRTNYTPGNIAMANLNTTNATWEISGTAAQTPWSAMTSCLRQNKYGYSSYDVFADSLLFASNYEFQQAQQTMNAQNLAYQFDKTAIPPGQGGYFNNLWEDIILGNPSEVPYVGGYSSGGALCLPKQSFAFIPWMPQIYKDGSGDYEDYAGGYGTVMDDQIPGMEYMVHGWRTQADTTSGGGHGYTQDSVTQWQVGFYIAYVQQYLSNANETPIYFFALQP